MLDTKIKLITSVLDVKFTGTSDLDKLAFIHAHFGEYQKAVERELENAYEEMVKRGAF